MTCDSRLVKDCAAIAVLEVVKVDRKENIITFKKVADLKGKHPENELQHSLLGSADADTLCEWAKPGRQAVFFSFGNRAVTCVGNHWNYNWDFGERKGLWSTASWVDDFRHTYVGSVAKLREAVTEVLAGKEVPRPMRDIDEVNPHAQRVRVAGDVDICRLISEKIRLDVPGDVPIRNIGIHAKTEARVLRAEAGL